MIAAAAAPSEPVIVYTGPTKTGPALIAAVAVDSEKQTPRRGKKGRIAGNKPAATAEATDAKSEAKPVKRVSVTIDPNAPAKPAGARHASAKPDASVAKPADKPAATAVKPAKPKAATKPAPKSTTGEAKPAADQKTAAPPRT
jgi:D-alanyl-D-alanine carboxypeptidase